MGPIPDRPSPSPATTVASAAAAALAYLAYAIALTWPVVLAPSAYLFADHGDARGWVWWMWASTRGALDGTANALLAAPFGVSASPPITQPITDGLALLLARLTNEIAAANLFVMLAFTSTALATYVVMWTLLRNRSAAFVGGLVFGFCPAAVMQAYGGHAAYAFNMFVPLLVLALVRLGERPSWRVALAVGAAFAAILFSATYTAYFALFAWAFFFVYDTVRAGRWRRTVAAHAAAAAFAILFAAPLAWRAVATQMRSPSADLAAEGRVRALEELFAFSARPWEFLVPSIDHPVLGRFVEGFVRANLHGSNAFEQTLYLGMVPLTLVGLGIVLSLRGRLPPAQLRYLALFGCAAAAMLLVTLPPRVGEVPTLSYLAYKVAPMFRVYSRAGLFVAFFVAAAAAAVMAHLAGRLTSRTYGLTAGAIAASIAFEFWSVGAVRPAPLDTPAVYRWLAAQPGDVVAEYPMVPATEAAFYSYPFWQRIHGNRLVNGASAADKAARDFWLQVRDLTHPDTPARLRAAGVDHVIVHGEMYRDGPIPQALKRYYAPERAAARLDGGNAPQVPAGFQPVAVFGPDAVYRLPP